MHRVDVAIVRTLTTLAWAVSGVVALLATGAFRVQEIRTAKVPVNRR